VTAIKLPAVAWVLGDREQTVRNGVTIVTRPLYYRPKGSLHPVRVGDIDPDHAEVLMRALDGKRR
jgi:hypothetical protein